MPDFPNRLRICADFYDAAHQAKLTSPPYPAASVAAVIGANLEIDTADFLKAYLAHKIGVRSDLYQSFRSIQNIDRAWTELEETVTLDNHTVQWHPNALRQTMTEHIGEAVGICTISKVHGLTDADWTPIPLLGRSKSKALDFKEASDSSRIIFLETKGIAPRKPVSSVAASAKSMHDDIVLKKAPLRSNSTVDAYTSGRDIAYGTISAHTFPPEPARVWLLDPPPPKQDINPFKWRLIARLTYVGDIMRLISPQSPLTAAIQNRVATLVAITSWKELDGRPLLNGNAKRFEIDETYARNRSHLSGLKTFGTIVGHCERGVFFVGIDLATLRIALRQDFAKIANHSQLARTAKVTASLLVTPSTAQSMGFRGTFEKSRIRIETPGICYFATGGLCFGWF